MGARDAAVGPVKKHEEHEKEREKGPAVHIATLALNGLLANPATSSLPYTQLATKAVEATVALDAELKKHLESQPK